MIILELGFESSKESNLRFNDVSKFGNYGNIDLIYNEIGENFDWRK